MVEKTPVEKNEPLLIVGNVKKPSLEIISATEPGSIIFDANFECGKKLFFNIHILIIFR